MQIVFARVDERLMHGIVMNQYYPATGAQRIMVVDDDVANNPMKKSAMMMAKPGGTAVSIIPLEKAINNFQAGNYEGQTVFLLAKSPSTMLKLMEAGFKIPELMIGATALMNEGVKLSDRAYITEEELADCRKIKEMGTSIIVQHNPSVPKQDMWKIVQ